MLSFLRWCARRIPDGQAQRCAVAAAVRGRHLDRRFPGGADGRPLNGLDCLGSRFPDLPAGVFRLLSSFLIADLKQASRALPALSLPKSCPVAVFDQTVVGTGELHGDLSMMGIF